MTATRITTKTTAGMIAALATGLLTLTAPAGAAPDDISANSPTSVKHLGVGKAEIKDADGLKLITHYLDANHSHTTGFVGSPTSRIVTQYYPIEGQKAVVTDAKGYKHTFYFLANG
jgi:hypothetical protein